MRRRLAPALISLAILVPLGFFLKLYRGPLHRNRRRLVLDFQTFPID